MTEQRELVVKKHVVNMWRVSTGARTVCIKPVACWFVVDHNTGEIVKGGYDLGHEDHSGASYIPRRKDAKAFIDGYNAQFLVGVLNPHIRNFKHDNTDRLISCKRRKGSDGGTEKFWDIGRQWEEQELTKKFEDLK